MSLASWKEEFYPVRASNCPREQALEHSILKWTGLLPENLEKHGVVKSSYYIETPDKAEDLLIDESSCALCQHHYHCRSEEDPCPIVLVTGTTCDSHYDRFIYRNQVTPMLDLLRQVKEALDAPQA